MMNARALFERLAGRAAKQEQAAIATFDGLTTAILEGKGVDEDSALANLDQAAREFDPVGADFAELVEVMADDPRSWWEPAALVSLAEIKDLFSVEFRSGSSRSKAIRMGKIAGRFVDERFDLGDSRTAILRKRSTQGHPGYAVEIEENENG
jgi:hypothetical protein